MKLEMRVSSKRVARRQQNAIRRFYNETIGELRKVSWPTRLEAYRLTRIVLAVIVVLSFVFFILDTLFRRFFALIFGA